MRTNTTEKRVRLKGLTHLSSLMLHPFRRLLGKKLPPDGTCRAASKAAAKGGRWAEHLQFRPVRTVRSDGKHLAEPQTKAKTARGFARMKSTDHHGSICENP